MKFHLPLAALLLTVSAGALHAEPPAAGGRAPAGWEEQREERHAAFEAALAKLPADKATLVKDSMQKNRENGKAMHEKIRALHDQEKSLLLAPSFDKSAYLAKSAEISKLHDQQQAARSASMADVASKLSAAERKVLVDAMEQNRPQRERGGPGGK